MGLCCDDKGDGQPEIPIPAYYHRNYALMPGDRPNNFELSAIYQLSFGRNQRYLTSGIGAAVAGGWQVNGVPRQNSVRSEINSFHTLRSGSICYDWCSCVATLD